MSVSGSALKDSPTTFFVTLGVGEKIGAGKVLLPRMGLFRVLETSVATFLAQQRVRRL